MDFSSEADAGASGITSAHVKSLLDKLEAALDPYTSNAIRAFVLQNARLRENATHLNKLMMKRQQESYRHLTLAERVEQNQEETKAVKAFVEEIERYYHYLVTMMRFLDICNCLLLVTTTSTAKCTTVMQTYVIHTT